MSARRSHADQVNHPTHYEAGGVECIEVIEALELGFHVGNALKYIWRAGRKGGNERLLEDLQKARFYLDREIARLQARTGKP